MENEHRRLGIPEWLILLGAAGFILVLGVSAYFQADIRLLHFFQSWMYIAATVLGIRRNRWGYFIGLSAAGLWNYINLFVTTFFVNGLQQIVAWASTGRLERPDLLIAVPAWGFNFVLICGCLWGYGRLRDRRRTDAWRFLSAFILTTGFFALAVALFQPRYLGLFLRILHPRLG